jgi:hypothetical protein
MISGVYLCKDQDQCAAGPELQRNSLELKWKFQYE